MWEQLWLGLVSMYKTQKSLDDILAVAHLIPVDFLWTSCTTACSRMIPHWVNQGFPYFMHTLLYMSEVWHNYSRSHLVNWPWNWPWKLEHYSYRRRWQTRQHTYLPTSEPVLAGHMVIFGRILPYLAGHPPPPPPHLSPKMFYEGDRKDMEMFYEWDWNDMEYNRFS